MHASVYCAFQLIYTMSVDEWLFVCLVIPDARLMNSVAMIGVLCTVPMGGSAQVPNIHKVTPGGYFFLNPPWLHIHAWVLKRLLTF